MDGTLFREPEMKHRPGEAFTNNLYRLRLLPTGWVATSRLTHCIPACGLLGLRRLSADGILPVNYRSMGKLGVGQNQGREAKWKELKLAVLAYI